MKIAVDTNQVSPHTLPLASALGEILGRGNVIYIHSMPAYDSVRSQGVTSGINCELCDGGRLPETRLRLCREVDLLLEHQRAFPLLETRKHQRKSTVYISERWFKPIRLFSRDNENSKGRGFWISGFWKMLFPFAWSRALKMRKQFQENNRFLYFGIGIHAIKDMARMCGILNGDWRCLFRAPELDIVCVPGGRVRAINGRDSTYCVDKMRLWGYFVRPSLQRCSRDLVRNGRVRRVLWIGRLLWWKRLDVLIDAVGGVDGLELGVYGSGPEWNAMMHRARVFNNIKFHAQVGPNEVRKLMREYDVFALTSSEFEGWGAVVSEAIEEGMKVVGTYEAGASATMLPRNCLVHVGDVKALRERLLGDLEFVPASRWHVGNAADAILRETGGVYG